MIQKNNIKELIQKITRRQKGLRDQRIMHPEREWFIGLFIMLLIFILSTFWSAHTYLKNKNIAVEKAEIEAPITYRDSIVKSVISTFDKREKELQLLYSSKPPQVIKEETVATTTPKTEVTPPVSPATTTPPVQDEIIPATLISE